MSTDELRIVLVRVLGPDWSEGGYTIAQTAIRRPVTFLVNRDGDRGEETLDGLVLIGDGNDTAPGQVSLEPLAREVGRHMLKVEKTPELLWISVAAHRDPDVGLWTLELVPVVAWFRLAQRTDETILMLAGVNPETGKLLDTRPCPHCNGTGSTGITGSPAGNVPIPCTSCLGTGVAQGMQH